MTQDITHMLAEDVTRVLDFLSRVMAATDDGGSSYLHEKSGQLARAAHQLHEHLSTKAGPGKQAEWDHTKRFNPGLLTALITRDALHYAAGRALYPIGGDPREAARQAALHSAANTVALADLDLTVAQQDAVARWLRARAGGEAS